jgi:hypothetical protein
VQLGEELLGQGEIESGVEHLANAVSVCGQPQQLLQVLQQTLPPQVFYMLMQQLPSVMNKVIGSQNKIASSSRLIKFQGSGATATVTEDDVE